MHPSPVSTRRGGQESATAIRRRGVRRNEMVGRKGETRLAICRIKLDSSGRGESDTGVGGTGRGAREYEEKCVGGGMG